ncbi:MULTISPECIES: macro domain-containing protein [unclassified Mucilaginibacter]|uniref:type II toxin-antitoxin system antitoxin DNA ADP-ribosyl glycohydrolase DarG n=1 Tax=unclassified Mucilaginibacter TaxID=2617802 RepID=UPI002AC9DA98|nr:MULTISPECIES: macro domain-containing protein [unclassified Mucilaginibacter]MEB0261659.1 macro domain-containing protein [Mucilaginibacter sp. 10I4]MEB0278524.1 macro domain-containing protein [Mucilaginibacter sp. 10B2]MEB0300744.1 macro domain-containing protein [Mucilaginibacter sp. 5C4]WPX23520.1 macro domain-containing protein [Mucilaginibacter sp. 5C4]
MKYLKGNLLTANTQALVNTVNTVGVMGKGIALQFKDRFAENFRIYAAACKRKDFIIGDLLVVKENTIDGEKIIINFPTKTEWFRKSQYEYIEKGLQKLAEVIKEYQIKSIAIPPLGCGNGGLKWDKVKPMIEKHLGHLTNVDIQVYEPNEAVKELLKKQDYSKDVKLTPARAMLLYAMYYYDSLGENTSLFVANKLAYFLQRLGETSFNKLKFQAHHYGPYSVGVEHVLHSLNGKYLKGLEQMSAKAFEPLELQYEKLQEVRDYIKNEFTADQKGRLTNLVKLINGFESTLSLEILATVDFVKKENPGIDNDNIVKKIHAWSDRKRKLFQMKYIDIATQHLDEYSNDFSIS